MAATPRTVPQPELRVSDADRDAVIAELSTHYQAGRLTADEFDDRSGHALTAKTGHDLAELLTDLPAPAQAQLPAPGRQRSGLLYMALIAAAIAVAVNIVVSVGTAGHVRVDLLPWWLIVAAFFGWRRFARR